MKRHDCTVVYDLQFDVAVAPHGTNWLSFCKDYSEDYLVVDYTVVADYVSVVDDAVADADVVADAAEAVEAAAAVDGELQAAAVVESLAKKRVHPYMKGFSVVQIHSSLHLLLLHSSFFFAPSKPSFPDPHGMQPC